MNSTPLPPAEERKRRRFPPVMKVVLPLAVVALGFLVMEYLVATAPKADRQPPPRTARLVEVTEVFRVNTNAVVEAMGTVEPAREVTIHPQVDGTVLALGPDFIPGGFVEEGERLLEIDRADYEINLRWAESDLATAQSDYLLEMGQQQVASSEFRLLGEGGIAPEEKALILREPQLARAKAQLDSARASLDQARLNLERTKVVSPFNAVISERHVDLGTRVSPSTPLVTLVDADRSWIVVPIPLAQLKWVVVPEEAGQAGSTVLIHPDGETSASRPRSGRVISRMAGLEEGGRMVQLLVEVEDPLSRLPEHEGLAPLLIGDFVRLEIRGLELPGVVPVSRRHLRGHDKVWVMNSEDELEVRTLEIRFRGETEVYASAGLAEGDRLIVTDLAAAVNGMNLRIDEEGSPAP